jgi:hypothetical protein
MNVQKAIILNGITLKQGNKISFIHNDGRIIKDGYIQTLYNDGLGIMHSEYGIGFCPFNQIKELT